MNDLAAMARLVDALRPWLGKLVIVGGWAHRLYRYSGLATVPGYPPILTLDADLAFSLHESLEGSIAAALKAASFHEHLSGDHRPPVSHYTLGEETHGFYAEFLAPLHGSGVRRSGLPDATVRRAGVTAQKLRYLELLLVAPVVVHLGAEEGFPLSSPAEVRLANPVGFIAQKLLIQPKRKAAKRAQDVLYVHDTLELFGGRLDALEEMWRERIRAALGPSAARTVQRRAREQFGQVTDVIRNAARIPA
ncbi:MAG TPA: GSU2403 family nucleotidyltransferase fold protein, partial [Longimicrobiaceae bacterium]|nr:GSU2403 family nucleotidyltransferase fold protein [Longimicrobiaceae bacterium]